MKNKGWLVSILLLAVVNLFFFWPGKLYFLNDDLLHIPLTDQGHLFQTNSVRPIHELLVRLDLFLWGKSAYGYHITALILHFIACLQLYDLSFVIQTRWLRIAREQAIQAALLAVVLFLAYPQSTESLAWILGRAPVLSIIFLMITVRLFFAKIYKPINFFTGAFFFAANLFTYEQSIFLPASLLLIAIQEKQKAKRLKMIVYIAILFAINIGYIISRKLITAEVIGGYEGNNLLKMNWGALLLNFFRLLFRLVLNPASKIVFISSASILILVVAAIMVLLRRMPINIKAIIFFSSTIVLLIAPVISLGLAVNSFESGRYLYLPSFFFIMAISIAGFSAFYANDRFKVPLIAFLIIVIIYWLKGKNDGSQHYADASAYSRSVELQIQNHFKVSSDTLYLDTLHVTVHRLPVFRRGFKTGINWFNNRIDTNKIVVRYLHDEVLHRQ